MTYNSTTWETSFSMRLMVAYFDALDWMCGQANILLLSLINGTLYFSSIFYYSITLSCQENKHVTDTVPTDYAEVLLDTTIFHNGKNEVIWKYEDLFLWYLFNYYNICLERVTFITLHRSVCSCAVILAFCGLNVGRACLWSREAPGTGWDENTAI